MKQILFWISFWPSITLATASAISLQLGSDSLSTQPGGTVTFQGTVTNDSGQDLTASDFFFNFGGYDPAAIDPIQELGTVSDFLIPNGATSPLVTLFDVTVVSSKPGTLQFPFSVQLEDINSDLSATENAVVVSASVAATVPEPATMPLVAVALFLAGVASWVANRMSGCKAGERAHCGEAL